MRNCGTARDCFSSDLRPPTSDLRPPTSDLWPLALRAAVDRPELHRNRAI